MMGRLKTVSPELPPRMIRRNRNDKCYYYYTTRHPERKEIPLGQDLKLALAEYKKVSANDVFDGNLIPSSFRASLMARIRKNAKTRGIEVLISAKDIADMFARCGDRCEITGIPFSFCSTPEYRIRAWIPSVDRIDSKLPYTKENCRLVCACVNSALNQFGEELLIQIAQGVLRTQRHKRNGKLRKRSAKGCFDSISELSET